MPQKKKQKPVSNLGYALLLLKWLRMWVVPGYSMGYTFEFLINDNSRMMHAYTGGGYHTRKKCNICGKDYYSDSNTKICGKLSCYMKYYSGRA